MKVDIICEAGINHCGSMDIAHEMILRAVDAGATTWKTQLYDVPSLFPNHEILAQGRNWYEEVLRTQLNKEQVFQLATWCKEEGIEFMASAFDIERIVWLEELGVKRHKMASRATLMPEVVQGMLLTHKEILISSGMASKGGFIPPLDYEQYNSEAGPLRYLYCVANYPTKLADLHLGKVKFPKPFYGFSDHSMGVTAAQIAIARGARIIEKHVTLSKSFVGPDLAASSTFDELQQISFFADDFEVINE